MTCWSSAARSSSSSRSWPSAVCRKAFAGIHPKVHPSRSLRLTYLKPPDPVFSNLIMNAIKTSNAEIDRPTLHRFQGARRRVEGFFTFDEAPGAPNWQFVNEQPWYVAAIALKQSQHHKC